MMLQGLLGVIKKSIRQHISVGGMNPQYCYPRHPTLPWGPQVYLILDLNQEVIEGERATKTCKTQ